MKNIIYYYKDSENFYIKNGYNNAIIRIPNDVVRKAQQDKDVYINLNTHLKNNNFFAVEKICERTMQLLIATSNRCNLKCPYCFEKYKNTYDLNDDLQDSLLGIINQYLLTNSIQGIDITFTGGEPLLNHKAIYRIIETMKEYYSNSYELEFSLITNGTIFQKEFIEQLTPEIAIQITLDGYRNSHDKLRIGDGINSTFDLICNNIDTLLAKTEAKIIIRVNMVSKEITDYIQLLELLSNRWGNKYKDGRISHYFAFLDVDPSENRFIFSEEEKLDFLFHIVTKEVELGLPIPIEYKHGSECMIRNTDGFAVDANGMIYDCFSFIGNKKYAIGNINEDALKKKTKEQFFCKKKDCVFYEKCYGGCIYSNFIRTNKLEPICNKNYIISVNKILFAKKLDEMEITHFNSKEEILSEIQYTEISL